MADSVLSKSWLFEVVNRKTNIIQTSFTLILPPQSYTVREKQRVSITKTFNNAFVDDYGPDNLEITIKGISGTAHVFPTYRTEGPAGSLIDSSTAIRSTAARSQGADGESYDGKGAFYTFRKDIMRYKDAGNFEDMELRVYDLADEQAYKCVLLEFTVDRNQDKPFWYPFTISLFVYARMDSKAAIRPKVVEIGGDPNRFMNRLSATADSGFDLYQETKNIVNQFSIAKRGVTDLRNKLSLLTTRARYILESPLTIAKNLLDSLVQANGIVYDTYIAGKMSVDKYVGSLELFEGMIRDALAVYGFAITEGSQQAAETTVETDDGVVVDAEGNADRVAVVQSFSYAGVVAYEVTSGDTLQSIALAELGDEALWPYVADINNLTDNDDLSPGDIIYVPVVASAYDTESTIISEDENADPYGVDIQLDQDGNIVVSESNDVALVSGLENLKQAIDARLSNLQGSLVKQSAYGIAARAGLPGTAYSLSYLRMSIRASLLEDPRIQDVKNLRVGMDGGVVTVSMEVIPTAYDTTLPVSVVV